MTWRHGLAVVLILFNLTLATLQGAADANPPERMTYQGFLVDANGVALGNTAPKNYDVIFRIYDDQSAGNKLWAEQQTFTVDKGYFSVLVGEGSQVGSEPRPALSTLFASATASDRFVEITVKGIGAGGGDSTILPRLRLLTSPYAFLARQATALVSPNGANLVSTANGALTIAGTVAGTGFSGSGANLTGLTAGQIPSLDAGKITSGTLADARISSLDAGKIISGTLADARLSANVAMRNAANTFSSALTAPVLGLDLNAYFQLQGGNPVLAFDAYDWFEFSRNDNTLRYRVGAVELLRVTPSTLSWTGSRVGIGTVSPTAPLEVKGYASANKSYGYLSSSGTTGTASGNAPYSIIAEYRVGASEFNAFSDARIKEVVGLSDSRRDLETIQKLRLTDYRPVDQVAEGKELRKGFIAQEVQEVIPEAVKTLRRAVPDIYALATAAEFDANRKTLAITLPKNHALQVGDRVRVFMDDTDCELAVVSVPGPDRFVVGDCPKASGQVFVYGKEVEDFLTVNYDRIFSMGISGLQELVRRVEALEARQTRMAELQQKAARVDALEKKLAVLAGLLDQLIDRQGGGSGNAASAAR